METNGAVIDDNLDLPKPNYFLGSRTNGNPKCIIVDMVLTVGINLCPITS